MEPGKPRRSTRDGARFVAGWRGAVHSLLSICSVLPTVPLPGRPSALGSAVTHTHLHGYRHIYVRGALEL